MTQLLALVDAVDAFFASVRRSRALESLAETCSDADIVRRRLGLGD